MHTSARDPEDIRQGCARDPSDNLLAKPNCVYHSIPERLFS